MSQSAPGNSERTTDDDDVSTRSADWLQPRSEERGLSGYLRTIRERLWLVVLAVVVTTGAAAIYVTAADEVYEAEAAILVTPVPEDATLLISVGLISRSADPLRDVETVARLIATDEVASRAQTMLEGVPEADGDPEDLLDQVDVEPVAESNIVSVTAQASDPTAAAEIANAFVEATIAQRTAELQRRVDERLAQLRQGAPR